MGILEFLGSIFSDKLPSLSTKIGTWCKYQWFRFFVNKEPCSEQQAIQHAYGVLSGHIDTAISFRNIDEKRPFILVKIRESIENPEYKFVLLKKIGNTFINDWEFEPAILITDFEVVDIQKNGYHNFTFVEQTAGTGADTKILNIVDLVSKERFKITEHRDHTVPKKPNAPDIIIEPNNIDEKLFSKIEKYAALKDMFKQNTVDFTKPEHAVQNWHRMNGEIKKGEVNLCFYSGKPIYGSGILETEETPEIEWIAYFKGPLFGYLKKDNSHFVAYSPGSSYNWPYDLEGRNKAISFKSAGEKFVFELKGDKGILR